jgi:hypothetical protein
MNLKLKSILNGLSSELSMDDIAKKHNVSVDFINSQLQKGIEVEYEHTPNKSVSKKIAMDHLVEIPNYYDLLEKMESKNVRPKK